MYRSIPQYHTHTHPLSRPQINISPCRLFVGSQISLLDIYQSLLIAGRNSDLAQLKYQQLFLGLQSSYPIPKITVKKRRILPCPWNHLLSFLRSEHIVDCSEILHQLIDGLSHYLSGFNMFQPSMVQDFFPQYFVTFSGLPWVRRWLRWHLLLEVP